MREFDSDTEALLPSFSIQHIGAAEEAQELVLDVCVESDVDLVCSEGLHLSVQRDHIHLLGLVVEAALDPHGARFLAVRVHQHLLHLQPVRVQHDQLRGLNALKLNVHLAGEGEVLHGHGQAEVVVARAQGGR